MKRRGISIIGVILFTTIFVLVIVAFRTNLNYGWAIFLRDYGWGNPIGYIALCGLVVSVAFALGE